MNTAIGNFTLTSTDLLFPSGLLGLCDWARTYNSLSETEGALGNGWTTAFSARLVPSAAQGLLHHTAGPVTFYDDDGRVLTFTPGADETFVTPPDLDGSLARNPDGSFTYPRDLPMPSQKMRDAYGLGQLPILLDGRDEAQMQKAVEDGYKKIGIHW